MINFHYWETIDTIVSPKVMFILRKVFFPIILAAMGKFFLRNKRIQVLFSTLCSRPTAHQLSLASLLLPKGDHLL